MAYVKIADFWPFGLSRLGCDLGQKLTISSVAYYEMPWLHVK